MVKFSGSLLAALLAMILNGPAAGAAEKPAQASPSANSPDGRRVATADRKTIRIFDLASGKLLMSMQGHDGAVTALVYAPDGKLLASGGEDKKVYLWDAGSGRAVMVLRGPKTAVKLLSFSPDARTLTAVGTDKSTLTWEVATGKVVTPKKGK